MTTLISLAIKLLMPIIMSWAERKGVDLSGKLWYQWAYSRWLRDVGAEAPRSGIDDPQPARRYGRHDLNIFRRRDQRED